MNKEDLTYDYIHDTNVYIYQRKDMFRINTDTSLLAKFMEIRKHEIVLDIGTNNGALLMVASLFKPRKLIGIDIQKEAIDIAEINLRTQDIPYELIHGNILDSTFDKVDVIICNPPYFQTNENGHKNISEYLKIARHEEYLSLEALIQKVSSLLDEKGRFYMVHRANRIHEIIVYLQQNRLCLSKLQFVYDNNTSNASCVLLEAMKDGSCQVKVLPAKVLK